MQKSRVLVDLVNCSFNRNFDPFHWINVDLNVAICFLPKNTIFSIVIQQVIHGGSN